MDKIECRAECLVCGKVWDKKNALMVGKTHHRKYDHKVVWEMKMETSGTWKSGVPKNEPNTLMPRWRDEGDKGIKNKRD